MKADDGMIQLANGEEYIIYAYDNGNDENDAMWNDKSIFAVDQDGEEHEVKYSDIVSYNEGNAFLGARAKAIEEDKEEFEFNGKTYKVTTKVNEGAVKRFEYDFNQMVKDIKRGYGWIDPEYVADTWENTSDSIGFEIVKGELYRRLIDLNLLAYAADDNPEEPGEYVKSLKSLNVKELVAEKKLTWESLKEKIKI